MRTALLTVIASVAAACGATTPSVAPSIGSPSPEVTTTPGPSAGSTTQNASSGLISTEPSRLPLSDASLLTPAAVEARLQTVEPSLALAPWSDDRDMGEYPKLVVRATTAGSSGYEPHVNAVLVYPSTSERESVQDDFQSVTIRGPRGFTTWDGVVHSEWIGFENVIVEVVMPGGSFGGRTPTPSESQYPQNVRDALSGS